MLIVNILDNVSIVVFAIDLDDNGFDRSVTFDEHAYSHQYAGNYM
jgi:hypothetical protein